MKKLMKKHKEVIMYLVFGVLTTAVNIVTYAFFTRVITLDMYSANIIAWVLAVLFAYVTNRKYVFESSAKRAKEKFKEIMSFYACRLFTFGIDMSFMFLMVDMLYINDMVSKVVVNVIVILLNYILSKEFIFKNK